CRSLWKFPCFVPSDMLHSPSGFPFWISRVTIGCGLFRFDTLPYYLLKVRLLQPLTGARSSSYLPEYRLQRSHHARRSAHPYSGRSEERRVGKECRSRRGPDTQKKKK